MNNVIKDGIVELVRDVYQNAKDHGWHDRPRGAAEVLALVTSETSEALEFERNKDNLKKEGINYLKHYTGTSKDLEEALKNFGKRAITLEEKSNTITEVCKKPDGLIAELADIVIRVMDYAGALGLEEEFVNTLIEKHEYNKSRPYKHGGKTI